MTQREVSRTACWKVRSFCRHRHYNCLSIHFKYDFNCVCVCVCVCVCALFLFLVCAFLCSENICFECGLCSLSADITKIILCDHCDAEYHFACAQISMAPRLGWTCRDCVNENNWYSKLRFDIPGTIFEVTNLAPTNTLDIRQNSSITNTTWLEYTDMCICKSCDLATTTSTCLPGWSVRSVGCLDLQESQVCGKGVLLLARPTTGRRVAGVLPERVHERQESLRPRTDEVTACRTIF